MRALCASLGVDLEVVRSKGRQDALYVRHMTLAFRPTGLYWAVCVFCGPAIERLRQAPIKEIVTTDSVYLPKRKRLKNMTILPVAETIAEAIRRIHHNESIGEIFKNNRR